MTEMMDRGAELIASCQFGAYVNGSNDECEPTSAELMSAMFNFNEHMTRTKLDELVAGQLG